MRFYTPFSLTTWFGGHVGFVYWNGNALLVGDSFGYVGIIPGPSARLVRQRTMLGSRYEYKGGCEDVIVVLKMSKQSLVHPAEAERERGALTRTAKRRFLMGNP